MSSDAPALPPLAAETMAAQPFAGYELLECLAAGERFLTFKATDKNLGRTVVLKALVPDQRRGDAAEEFFTQAGSIAGVRAAKSARGLDAGRGGRLYYMSHEYVRGESLKARLERRQGNRMTERELLPVVAAVAGALQELFDLGQSHGYLRPGNAMFAEGGGIRLLDLGFAWTVAYPDDHAAFVASPDFVPPERLAGGFNIDVRGDLYSLGVMWHLALMGRPPFRGVTPEATFAMYLEQQPENPREADPRLSSATSRLILWLMEKDRDARPRTPREFLERLAEHPLMPEEKPAAAELGNSGAETADNTDEEPLVG